VGLASAARLHKMQTRARVLTFDIERRPGVYLEWAPRNGGFMGRDKQLIRSSTISFAAKWYGEKEVFYAATDPVDQTFMQPHHVPGYLEMLVKIRDLLDEADIVVGYNSIRFDEAKLRGEFARMEIDLPSPYRSLDLMRTSKRMGWDYASLAESLDAFGLGGKVAHQGWSLWIDFMRGDPKAHALMEKYNRGDVTQTERLMDAMRPFIKDHPNLALWAGHDDNGNPLDVCANCGHGKLETVPGKLAYTAMTAYGLVRCRKCGTHLRRNIVKERIGLRHVR